MKKKVVGKRYIVGVDEAGRGPLAGPVAVGVACVPAGFDWGSIPGVGDSKKVSEKNREAIFLRAKELKKKKKLNFAVSLVSASMIDRVGITRAVSLGIERSFKKLALDPDMCDVRLDGLLSAPKDFGMQQTIIKGDQKEKVIGLASIMAKVTRDTYMKKIASTYPEYDFAVHKGYGTAKHRTAILTYGRSPLHRVSFTSKICKHTHIG